MKIPLFLVSLFLSMGSIFSAAAAAAAASQESKKPELFLEMYKKSEGVPFCANLVEMGERIWKEFPYCYVANDQLKEESVDKYKKSSDLRVLVARTSDDQIAAISFSLPLSEYDYPEFLSGSSKWTDALRGVSLAECFYISETLVEPVFRHQGIASRLYAMLEEDVRKSGYKAITRLIIEHPKEHPLKPGRVDQRPAALEKSGYTKTDFLVSIPWPTIVKIEDGKEVVEEQVHSLRLWVKVF